MHFIKLQIINHQQIIMYRQQATGSTWSIFTFISHQQIIMYRQQATGSYTLNI